jgi:curved DNA-binding protein CbpA
MLQIGTLLLANVFAALLPPVDPDEVDFYEILGVESNATDAQIRKAYKSKSLKLHPDKVAQRRDYSNKEEAAAEYEKVQEAYSVLVNE